MCCSTQMNQSRYFRPVAFPERRRRSCSAHAIATQPWLVSAEDPAFLDALDAALRFGEFEHDMWTSYGNPSTLEQLLASANSAWRVNGDGRALERRLDKTVTAAAQMARANVNAEATDHLSIAGDAVFGRSQDPDKAYDEAVLAVEALACPLVCPNNPRRSLGTVIQDLRNQTSQWQLTIGDRTGQPASPIRLVEMLGVAVGGAVPTCRKP